MHHAQQEADAHFGVRRALAMQDEEQFCLFVDVAVTRVLAEARSWVVALARLRELK